MLRTGDKSVSAESTKIAFFAVRSFAGSSANGFLSHPVYVKGVSRGLCDIGRQWF